MAKINWKKPKNEGQIKSPQIPQNDILVFSFTYFAPGDPEINCAESPTDYFHQLLGRLKLVGQMKAKEFKTCHAVNYAPLRAHPIDWNHPKIIKNGFGIPRGDEFDDEAWQFSISKAAHGRVHGFLIDTVFHIVWLDPKHRLYPWD